MSMIILSVAVLWMSTYSSSKYQVIVLKNQMNVIRSVQDNNTIENKLVTTVRLIQYHVYTYLTILDYITCAWFIIDLSIRFIVAPNKSIYMHKFDNIVDILATFWLLFESILQIYVDSFLMESIHVIRVLRLLRLLSYHSGLKVIITSIKTSVGVLQLLIFILLIASILYGAFIYYAERLTTHNPNKNDFHSIIEGFWYSIVSLTTIGYK